MIVRRLATGGGWIVKQTDHARPCGPICERLHPCFIDAQVRRQMIELCMRHDDGWTEWERAPRTQPDGAPVDFQDMEADEHAAIWDAGIAAVQRDIGPFAAAVLARHAQALAEPESPRFDDLSARVALLSRSAFPQDDPAVREWRLERAFHVLRLCDLATLMPCAGWCDRRESPLLDADGHHCDVEMACTRPWTVEIDPWPFAGDAFEVAIRLVRVEGGDWAGGLARTMRRERELQYLAIRPRKSTPFPV